MKKISLTWEPKLVAGKAHPGCCTQNGGCGKKHGK